jgi:hypothetical protein
LEGRGCSGFIRRQKNNGGLLTGKLLYGIKNEVIIMERDRIKVEGRIMLVDKITIGRRKENKDMIME